MIVKLAIKIGKLLGGNLIDGGSEPMVMNLRKSLWEIFSVL